MRASAFFAAVVTLCPPPAFAATYTGNNCGSNTVTEIQSGAIRLPSDDVVIEHTPAPSPPGITAMRVTATVDTYPALVVICNEPPGPTSRCEQLSTDGTTDWLPSRHAWILVETEQSGASRCGNYHVEVSEQ